VARLGPRLTRCFFGRQESLPQTRSRSIQPFLHSEATWSCVTDRLVAKFRTISSYHLTDFQFFYKLSSQVSVTDMTCLLPTTHHAWRHFVDKQSVAKRIMTEFPGRNWSLAFVKRQLHQIDTTGSVCSPQGRQWSTSHCTLWQKRWTCWRAKLYFAETSVTPLFEMHVTVLT